MPTAYALGKIKSAYFVGAGLVTTGETIMDGRTVDEVILQNGRAYFATNDGTGPHIIGSLPAGTNQMGRVLRNEPVSDTVTGETGNDTVTG